MSLRKGDNSKTGQKFQNRKAFKIMFDTKAIEIHQHAAMDHLCQKCFTIIKWKMQYNKYKKVTSEKRCVKCLLKNINKSYRHACDRCSNLYKICAKCLVPNAELTTNPTEEKKREDENLKEMEEYLTKLRERTRRALTRKIQKDLVTWDEEKKHFIEIESGLRLDNLKFKQGLEGEDIVDEADECDEFEDKDFEKKVISAAEGQDEKKKDGEEQEIPVVKQKTMKEMLEAAKNIDFGGSSDEDEDDEEEEEEEEEEEDK